MILIFNFLSNIWFIKDNVIKMESSFVNIIGLCQNSILCHHKPIARKWSHTTACNALIILDITVIIKSNQETCEQISSWYSLRCKLF